MQYVGVVTPRDYLCLLQLLLLLIRALPLLPLVPPSADWLLLLLVAAVRLQGPLVWQIHLQQGQAAAGV
jgi:hypothetical protein